jgi:hypothetical protein
MIIHDNDLQPTRWWHVVRPDCTVWCETSDLQEARERMRPGDRLERLYTHTVTEWRPV